MREEGRSEGDGEEEVECEGDEQPGQTFDGGDHPVGQHVE